MKLKKFLALSLSTVMALSLMAGCSGNSSTSTQTNTSTEVKETADAASSDKSGDDKQITLRFMWWGGDERNEATLAVINKYMEAHPNVKIEAEMNSSDGYIDKMSTMLANGTAPDIMQQNVDAMPDFISRGDFFVDLNEYKDTMDLTGFKQDFINQFGTWDGHLFALPTGLSCLAMVVNKDTAEKSGIDLTQQFTWDSLLEVGQTVNKQNPENYFLNVDSKILCEYVLRPYLRQETGKSFVDDETKTISFTKDQLVEVLTYIKECYDTKVFQPASESATFKEATQTNPKWIDGSFVAGFAPSSSIKLMTDANPNAQFTVVQMPLAENRVSDGFFADTPQYLTVNKNSENVETAVDFLNYFYNDDEAATILKDVRSIPPVESARQLCLDKGLLNDVVVNAVNMAADLNGKSDKGISTGTEVYAIQQDMIESIAYGQSTPEEAADLAIELIQDYLDGLK